MQKGAVCGPQPLTPSARWYDKCPPRDHLQRRSPAHRSGMAKPMPGKTPDPMSKVVDRLLAQLPGLEPAREPAGGSSIRYATQVGIGRPAGPSGTPGELLGLWFRVVLGFTLGAMM